MQLDEYTMRGNSFLLNHHISCWSCFLRKWYAHEWRHYERSLLHLTAAKKRLQWNSFNRHTINKSWNIIILRVLGGAAFKQNFPTGCYIRNKNSFTALEICQEEECIRFQYEYKEDNNGNMKLLISHSINKVQSRSHLGHLDLLRNRSNAGNTRTSCCWFHLISLISMRCQQNKKHLCQQSVYLRLFNEEWNASNTFVRPEGCMLCVSVRNT